MIDTSELDCTNEDATNQNAILFHILSVLLWSKFSNVHQVKLLNHCCKNIIQNKNIATHAATSVKSGLIINQYINMMDIVI
jgi:hypothetical protein